VAGACGVSRRGNAGRAYQAAVQRCVAPIEGRRSSASNLLIFGRDIESAARRDFPTLPRDQGLALRVIAEKMKVSDVSISHAGVKNALTAADRQQVPS
jgi:hypothetical protein